MAELETAYTIEKAKVDSLQASLFKRLRVHSQERNRLRLVVSYRKQFLEVLSRQGDTEAEQEFRQAKARSEQEYEETAQTLAARRELTEEEQAELRKLWKKLVGLYHPDRFAHEPDKLEIFPGSARDSRVVAGALASHIFDDPAVRRSLRMLRAICCLSDADSRAVKEIV